MGDEDSGYDTISIRLPRLLINMIREYGKRRGLNLSDSVKVILLDYFGMIGEE